MMRRTIRPWWRLGLLALSVLAVIVGIALLGWMALSCLIVTALLAFWARPRVQLDPEGLRYRGMFPREDFAIRWAQMSQLVVDQVQQGSPGNPQSPVARVRVLSGEGPGHMAWLWSLRAADPVVEAGRQAGIPILDER